MAPKVKPDDLVDALYDPRVLTALTAVLSPLIETAVQTAIDKGLVTIVEAAVDRKMGDLLTSIREMGQTCTTLRAKADRCEGECNILREKLTQQARLIDDLEASSRCENLIFRGVPEQSYAERGSSSHSAQDRNLPLTSY